MRRSRSSLFARVSLLLVLMGLVPMAVCGAIVMWLVWDRAISDFRDHVGALSGSTALQIREILRAHEDAIVRLSELPGRMGEPPDSPRFIPLMREQMDLYASNGIHVSAWVVLERDGTIRACFPRIPFFRDMDFLSFPGVRGALVQDRISCSPSLVIPGFLGPVVIVAVPRGQVIILGFIPIEDLSKRLQDLNAVSSARLLVWDSKGYAVSHPDNSFVRGQVSLESVPPVSWVLGGAQGPVSYEEDGKRWLGAVTRLSDLGWGVLVAEPEEKVLAFFHGIFERIWVVVALTILVAILASLGVVRVLMRPLEGLTGAFDKMGRGELAPEELPQSPFREFEAVRGAFQDMARKVKEREEALRVSEERYKLVVENATDMIAIVQDGYVKFINKAFPEVTGRSIDEITSRPFHEFVYPEDREMVLEHHRRRMRGEPVRSHYTFRVLTSPKGDYRTVEIRAVPIMWEGRPASLCFLTDITDRLKREEALRVSEERYKLVVNNAQDAILIAQDRMLKFVNPRMAELLGYPEEEITSRLFIEFIHPDDRQMVLERHERRLKGEKGLPTSYQFRVVTRSQETKWVEIRVLPVTWEGRSAALGFLTDITQRLESEKALRESEERYRTLVESSPDGFFMAEVPSGRITFVNNAICTMFGYRPDEALRMRFWEVLAPEEVERADGILRQFLDGHGLPREPLTFKTQKRDGGFLFVEVRVALVTYKGRELLQAVVRDVTEQTLFQRQLEHSQRMQALGTLASGVAHEFNNILAAIQGFAQLLEYVVDTKGEGGWYLQEIISSCQRASSLTHRMLSLARTDEGQRVILKLNQVVEKAQGLLTQTLPPTITVKTDLTGGLPFVLGDPTQLEQVLLNLALNARDAMPQGGTILIGTRFSELPADFSRIHTYVEPGRYVEVYVQDEGVGIPKGVIGRIFEPFFTTKEPGKGTGLGLSVSYSIVKNHKGFIIAQSPPEGRERGSILRVFLPPYEAFDEPEPQELDSKPAPKGKGERILVVDDEPQIRRILREALERHNYRVEEAPDGQLALIRYLQALERGRPFDAVIMDLAMPVKDGAWATGRILDADPEARILIATGHTDEKLIPQDLTSKAKAVLKKPLDIGILLKNLRECLERGRTKHGIPHLVL